MSVELLKRAVASTDTILSNVTSEQMDSPSPCASWKVRDVVNHVVGSTNWFADTLETGVAPVPEGNAGGPDASPSALVAAFREGSARAINAFSAPGAMEKILKLPFGEMPGGAFVMLATSDVFQHGWDLAKATGQSTDLDPELAGQLLGFAKMAIPDAFRGPDGKAPFGPQVQVAVSASVPDQLAGFLGRTV
jgi:uncharacterized protein (TIGR03086 family)